MPFDIQLAIANLDFKIGGDPNLDALRLRYPEIAFVFDLLDDKCVEADEAAEEHGKHTEELEREYESRIDDLEARVNDLRLALFQIKELTLDAEITNLIEEVL